jgi:hypothetical protein
MTETTDPQAADFRTVPPKITPVTTGWQAWWEDHDLWDGFVLYADLDTARQHAAVDYVGEEYGWVPGDDPADEAPDVTLTWAFERERWHLLDNGRSTPVQLYKTATYAPAAAPSAPADRAALRDRIAAAIWERQNPGRRWADCEYRWRADAESDADAVLAVLPEPADDAAGVAEAIRSFPFDNFGMDDVSFALEDDPEAQEWVPALADAVLATLPATTARAVELRDYWHGEAMSATTRIIELQGQLEELRRTAGEAQQPETQADAHPPTVTWEIESPRRGTWSSWGTTYDEHDWARQRFEDAIGHVPARQFRLVRATTVYTVEAESAAVARQADTAGEQQ